MGARLLAMYHPYSHRPPTSLSLFKTKRQRRPLRQMPAKLSLGTSFVLDPPKFCCVISKKSAQVSRNFRAVTTCGQRHHKFELLFPQLFERGAEDYVDRGRRGVAGRARTGVQAPGHSLQPIVSVIPALNVGVCVR